jgi:uncharacterized protein
MDGEAFKCFDPERAVSQVAETLGINRNSVRATVELLDAGNTIPFIARYRKEATQSLSEQALRDIDSLMAKARELGQRKETILKTIQQQEKLTDALRRQIENCQDLKQLEEIYLPYRPKRRTRATAARERGLEPLAEILLRQETLHQSRHAVLQPYVSAELGVPDEESALAGACDIVAETWADNASVRHVLLEHASEAGYVYSRVKRGKDEPASKFEMYFEHQELCKNVPSHRFLAMRRGETEGVLRVGIQIDSEAMLRRLKSRLLQNPRFEFHSDLLKTVDDCFERLLFPAIESTVLQELRERAESEAIAVFARNLRELLLAAPAGAHSTIGIDPGFRTGCKIAVVDGTGKFLHNTAIYPTPPRSDFESSAAVLRELIAKFQVRFIAIGNGTASRETDAFVTRVLRDAKLDVTRVVVSESGASVYSASELAAREHPDLDVTVRGALSIARRLQDPLAELVKIDPKAIGVGQYQHDVNQTDLRKSLDAEVESCVNLVGVDVNMASAPLLSYVSGIGPKLAERIVAYRDEHGRFESRKQLRDVPKLGANAFEQSAGFLRIRDAVQPLDNSAVHPERYQLVQRMAADLKVTTKELVGNASLAAKLNAKDYVSDAVGLPTIQDILAELAKPGRDPRSEFRAARFTEGVSELKDLRKGMMLEGCVTNVTKFGAFVDIGVHQDGLVHISELSNTFVKDPSEVVSVGDVVRVKVLDVDLDRKRISLSRKQASAS